jgi:hypothetical protein
MFRKKEGSSSLYVKLWIKNQQNKTKTKEKKGKIATNQNFL